LEWRGLDVTQ